MFLHMLDTSRPDYRPRAEALLILLLQTGMLLATFA